MTHGPPDRPANSRPTRSLRRRYATACAVVVCLGLASRRYGDALPPFVARYAGDMLWATMAFLGISMLLPRLSLARRAIAALLFCFAIEASQAYHRPWLDDLRRTTIGALALGRGFVASDLLCYTVGVALGATMEVMMGTTRRPSVTEPLS